MPAITSEQLNNASVDADTLGEFVNGVPGDVSPREGADYPNVRKIIDQVLDGGGLRIFEDETALQAYEPDVPTMALVMSDPVEAWKFEGSLPWVEAPEYFAGIAEVVQPLVDEAEGYRDEAETFRDEAEAAAASSQIIYVRGAPDSSVPSIDGATAIEYTTGRQYGPKAGGVWPTAYVQNKRIGPKFEPVTVVFMMGQSNADGQATPYTSTTALSSGYGYEYYCDASGFGSVLPLGPNRLGRLAGGPQSAFAQTWAAAGGGACIFVDCAAGGSSMSTIYKTTLTGAPSPALLSGGTWDQSDAANIYTNYLLPHMQLAMREIANLGFNIQRSVAYWSQGEQDRLGNSSQASYDASFRAFLNQFHRDWPGTKFLIERLGNHRSNTNATAAAAIRAAQTAVAADTAYSGWVTIASTLAEGFTLGGGSPDYTDDLHYSQPAYNSLGAQMATSGLTFTGATSTLPVPDGIKYADLLANLPIVGNWYRLALKTKANGAFGLSAFNDPANNYCTTFYDTTGLNRVDATQTLAWTFPSAAEKEVIMYVHVTATGDISLISTATSAISDLRAVDADFPLHTINITSTGAQATGFALSDAKLYRLPTSKMRVMAFGLTSADCLHAITNVTLDKLPGLTTLSLTNCPLTTTLDLTKVPNLTIHNQATSGLTVAEVNARLIALDANGKINGNCTLNQFVSGKYAAANPTGAGAAAKTALQGKGWTVTTG